MKASRWIGVLAVLQITTASSAQASGFNSAKLAVELVPSSRISGSGMPAGIVSETVEGLSTSLEVERTQVSAQRVVSTTVSYRNTRLAYSRGVTSAAPGQLHDLGLGARMVRVVSSTRSWVLFGSASLGSDMRGRPAVGDLRFLGGGIYNFTRGQRTIGVGAAITGAFGPPLPVPFVMFNWGSANKMWRVSATPPFAVEVWFQAGESAQVGIISGLQGGSHLLDLRSVNEVHTRQGSLGPSVVLRAGAQARLRIDAGVNFLRRVTLEQSGGDSKGSLRAAGFLRVALHVGRGAP